MQQFIVTDRTTPKINGKFRPPGTVLNLDPRKDYLIIDQLEESGSIRNTLVDLGSVAAADIREVPAGPLTAPKLDAVEPAASRVLSGDAPKYKGKGTLTVAALAPGKAAKAPAKGKTTRYKGGKGRGRGRAL